MSEGTGSLGALEGVRVVDLTIAMAGPLAAMRLGDLGATVVKVEPVEGEWQRHNPAGGAAGREVNASFLALNRNKRSIALNLKASEGRQIVLELAARSDVFVQNYRPGVAARSGSTTTLSVVSTRTSFTLPFLGTAKTVRTRRARGRTCCSRP